MFLEAAIAIEECESLRLKLQQAEVVTVENTKEFDLLKSELLKKDIEVESLKKEKKSFEENILFLSDELSMIYFYIFPYNNFSMKAVFNFFLLSLNTCRPKEM